MPTLTWPGKRQTALAPASPTLDSIILPGGRDYAQNFPINRLYLGDNLGIMAALLPAYEGKIHLIYIDPPFFTNRKFPARIGRGEDSRKPSEWQLSEGYTDAWNSLDEYIQFLYERLALMHRLLAPTGTLYLHLDWHASAYARLLLDEIFGQERLLNEIIWTYHGPSPIRSAFNRKHDTILAYTKTETYTFNADDVRIPYDPTTIKTFESSPKAGFGKVPDLQRGKVPEDWWYFPVVARLHNERTGYPTQKPAALLERIIRASSNPGDLVADFFCGSGTTPLSASRLGRNFIASDATFRAIHTAKTRLVRENAPGFEIWTENSALPAQKSPFKFHLADNQVWLDGETTPTYWEVDPHHDGQVFRSVTQSTQPLRKGAVGRNLPLGSTEHDASRVRIRVVDADGRQYQQSPE